ncbi:hypothetical protein CK203_051137 [Vitis vinifera]|uniref:Uncharacterized protein n=1 Tax=Vitis vinifera TaxID=29760 RepID=A0A438HEF1_VITVI|nr:hypothetical protein CK203_051137 [Vitis vinifera]
MNFMSYVAEVSREWDELNARDMERMTSQPKAKEMNQMQPVQAISQTPLQAMPCAICLSYEHLVDECPTIPAEGKCLVIATPTIPIGGTIQISLGNHSRLSTSNLLKHHSKPQALNKLCARERKLSFSTLSNSMSIHEMEAQEGESSMVKEIEEVITLRSGKEVDLPTCKLEHK